MDSGGSQADYYRYIAEFRSGDEKSKAAEEARKAYAEAAKVASEAPWEYHGNCMGKNTGIDMVSDVVSINETSQVRSVLKGGWKVDF